MNNLFEDYNEDQRIMLQSAYDTITILEAWDFLQSYNPPKETGFSFDSNPQILKIMNEISKAYYNHSGCTMALTMRKMQEYCRGKKKTIIRKYVKKL